MCVCVQEKFHVYFLHDFDRYRQAVQTFFLYNPRHNILWKRETQDRQTDTHDNILSY